MIRCPSGRAKRPFSARGLPGALRAIARAASRPWFSYATLLLLQLKVMWGVWQYRDLTPADESIFYNRAYLWFNNQSVDIAWSPLYTSFLGTLMHLSTQAYFVIIFHRIIVVLVIDVLLLMLMRRLLPHPIAWLLAAWWAILPINFDAVFTVHLFTVIPILLAWLVILYWPSPWARGTAIAILLLTTILVRNEYLVATVALVIVCTWWDIKMSRTVKGPGRAPHLVSYGIPLLLCAAVVVFFYTRSVVQFSGPWNDVVFQRFSLRPGSDRPNWSLQSWLSVKHTLNMCQAYAFGYQQRHPEWNKSPWLDCSELMQSTFGEPLPSLPQMIRSDPAAVLRHFWWNIRLTPSGIELLLFNASAGGVDPDYAPADLGSRRALLLGLLTAAVVTLGSFLLYRDRYYWWEHCLKDRALGWLAMLSVVAVAALIIPTQRPRPSYLFPQGIVLMAMIGMCVVAIDHRWPVLRSLYRYLPIAMVILPIVVPNRYEHYSGPRPLLALYERLTPFADAFNRAGSKFLVSAFPVEIHAYVGHNYFTNPFENFDYSILDQAPRNEPLSGFLERRGINLVYVDEALWRRLDGDPVRRPFVAAPQSVGWRVLAFEVTEKGPWMLLEKQPGLAGHPHFAR